MPEGKHTASCVSRPELTADDIYWSLEPLPHDPIDDDPLVNALLDAEAYRLVAQETLHCLHRLQRDHGRLYATHLELVEEYRRFRVQLLRKAEVMR
jgi:hypothetical protein